MGNERAAPRRIWFYNRFYWPDESATAQILTDLAGHLAEHHWQVRVVSSRLRYEKATGQPALPRRQIHQGVHIERLWSTSFGRRHLPGRLVDYLSFYASLFLHLLRKPQPGDLVVLKTDPPLLSIPGWLAAQLRPLRLVAWCQDLFPEVAVHALPDFPGRTPLFGCLQALRTHSLNGCEQVVAISGDMQGMLRETGVRRPVACLPNWAVQHTAAAQPDFQALRREWDLQGRVVLGYSGNLGRAHETRTFLEALPALSRIPQLTLLFVGGGRGLEVFREAAAAYPANFLHFLPYQQREHLAEALKVPHVHWFSLLPPLTPHVSPSKFYGILEAGRPVLFIGDPESALARTIRSQGCGRVVAPGHVDELVSCVEELVGNPDLRQRMGEAARTLATGSFSRKRRLEAWQQQLEILHETGGAAPA